MRSNFRGSRSRSSVYTATFIQDRDCDLDRDPVFLLRVNGVLDKKILFGSIPHLTHPEIRKMLVEGMFGNKIPHSILIHDLLSIEIRIQYLKLAM